MPIPTLASLQSKPSTRTCGAGVDWAAPPPSSGTAWAGAAARAALTRPNASAFLLLIHIVASLLVGTIARLGASAQNRLNVNVRPEGIPETPVAESRPERPRLATAPALEFRLLGPLEVRKGGEVVSLGGARQRALIALLCLQRGAVMGVERIVDELWGESPPRTARHMVEVYVSKLRKLLGADMLTTRAPGYLLEVGPEHLDVSRFERLLGEGKEALAAGDPGLAASNLADALALWRGPPLADFAYEPFAQAEIARLEECRLQAEEARFEAELELGRGADLVPALEKLVAEAPFRERVRAQLMRALYHAGRQADALAAYRAARETLVEELGVEPSAELRELERAILAQDDLLLSPSTGARAAPETRRVATILFAEPAVEGPGHDPEALRPALERSLERAEEILKRHGAAVERAPDETVMAVFGSPVAHEDDAARSLRAVIELRALGVVSRAAVDTGEVLAGGETTVRGPVVRAAAQLLAAASQGDVLAAEVTRQLASASAQFEAVDVDRRTFWRLVAVIPGAPARPLLLDVPVVGRTEELAELRASLSWTIQEGRPGLVTILGEAGVGKSRLAREFAMAAQANARVLTGRCLAYGEGITYWPVREVLGELAPEGTVAELEALFTDVGEGEGIARRLGATIGLLDEIYPVEEIRWAARRLFETLAQERPLLLILEDVHWAEQTFLDLVRHAVEAAKAPLLVLCLARPELLEEHPYWAADDGRSTILALEALSRREAVELVSRLDPAETLSHQQRKRILEAAEGNPLFVEQLVAFTAETGPRADTHDVPLTLQALLAARLDRLGPGERAALTSAAVIGREFSADTVVELLPPTARPTALRHLETLERRKLIEPQRATHPFENTFRFRHILIQEAAYRSLPKQRRAELHEHLASWLERTPAALTGDEDEIVGYHLEQAHWYWVHLGLAAEALEVGDRAAQRLARAGERALARGDARAAVSLLGRALALTPDEPRRLEISVRVSLALDLAGEIEQADALLGATIDAAATVGETRTLQLARIAHAFVSQKLTPREWTAERSREVAEEAIEALTELGDELGLSRAWDLSGAVARETCRFDEAAAACRTSLDYARRAGDESAEIDALLDLLFVMYMGTTPLTEIRREAESLLKRVGGLSGHEADVLFILGGVSGLEGSRDQARALYVRAKALRAQLGQELGTGSLWAEEVALVFDDGEFAERELRAGYELLEHIGETSVRSLVAAHLAEALYLEGRYDEAEHFGDTALRIAGRDDVASQARGRAIKARVLATSGHHARAQKLAREAVELLSETDDLVGHARALVSLAEVLRLDGREGEAAKALRSAVQISERKGNVVTAQKARALLGELAATPQAP